MMLNQRRYDSIGNVRVWPKVRRLNLDDENMHNRNYASPALALGYILQSYAATYKLLFGKNHYRLYKLLQVLSLVHDENQNVWSATADPMVDQYPWVRGVEIDFYLTPIVGHLAKAVQCNEQGLLQTHNLYQPSRATH
jgi:hypothetical protein